MHLQDPGGTGGGEVGWLNERFLKVIYLFPKGHFTMKLVNFHLHFKSLLFCIFFYCLFKEFYSRRTEPTDTIEMVDK